jgi:hypothetical protein
LDHEREFEAAVRTNDFDSIVHRIDAMSGGQRVYWEVVDPFDIYKDIKRAFTRSEL